MENMSYVKLASLSLALFLAGCANATRTIPVPVIEHRPISSIDTEELQERKRLSVPQDRSYLPTPVESAPLPPARSRPYNDPVLRDIQRNNYNSGFKPNTPRT